MSATTPYSISPQIEAFCKRIVPTGILVWVKVGSTVPGSMNNCYSTVDKQVRDYGGIRVDGWSIWEATGLFLQSEHHAVWNNGTELVDITEKLLRESRTLFLPDATVYNTELPVMNHMDALTDALHAKQYVEANLEHNAWRCKKVEGKTKPRGQILSLKKMEIIEQYWGLSPLEKAQRERTYPNWFQIMVKQVEQQLDERGMF